MYIWARRWPIYHGGPPSKPSSTRTLSWNRSSRPVSQPIRSMHVIVQILWGPEDFRGASWGIRILVIGLFQCRKVRQLTQKTDSKHFEQNQHKSNKINLAMTVSEFTLREHMHVYMPTHKRWSQKHDIWVNIMISMQYTERGMYVYDNAYFTYIHGVVQSVCVDVHCMTSHVTRLHAIMHSM